MVASDSSYPFSKLPATNGGSSSSTFCMPSVIVVLLSHHFQLLQPYSAVDTGTTFFSLPSFIFTFLPPSFAKPGTSIGAGGGRLKVYDAIKSSVVHADTLRALTLSWPVIGSVLGVCSLGATNGGTLAVKLRLSSSYWPTQWTTAPTSRPCIHVSAGPS